MADPFADFPTVGKPGKPPAGAGAGHDPTTPTKAAGPGALEQTMDVVSQPFELAAGLAKETGHVLAEGWRGQEAAQHQLAVDIDAGGTFKDDADMLEAGLDFKLHPNDPKVRARFAEALRTTAERERARGRLGFDILGAVGGGFTSGVTTASLGEAGAQLIDPLLRSMTGGKWSADPEKMGAVLSVVIPFLGEANEARAVTGLSEKLGIPEATARQVLHQARKAYAVSEAQATANRAARRLLGKREGQAAMDPAAIRAKAEESRRVGAGQGTILGHMEQRGQRVVRGAGAQHPEAGKVLSAHRKTVREGISGVAAQRTRQERPYNQTLKGRINTVTTRMKNLAAVEYRPAYATEVQTDDHLMNILDDPPVQAAIRSAKQEAHSRMLDNPESARIYHDIKALQKYTEDKAAYDAAYAQWKLSKGMPGTWELEPTRRLKQMLDDPDVPQATKDGIRKDHGWKPSPEPTKPEPPKITAGTIDRILHHTREVEERVGRVGKRGQAGGIESRAKMLDTYLDGIKPLEKARAHYKQLQRQLEQLGWDDNIQDTPPEDFDEIWNGLNAQERLELQHNVANRLADAMAAGASRTQSQADMLGTTYYGQANLRTILGKDVADNYLKANGLIVDELKAATFVDPALGSKTAGVIEDLRQVGAEVGLDLVAGHWGGAKYRVFNYLMKNMTGLTAEEAQQIAEWVVSQDKIEDTLATIEAAAQGNSGGSFNPIVLLLQKLPKVPMPTHIAGLMTGAGMVTSYHQSDERAAAEKQRLEDEARAKKAIASGADPFSDFNPNTPHGTGGEAPPTAPDSGDKSDVTSLGASTTTISTSDPAFVKHASQVSGIGDDGITQLFLDVGGVESAVGVGKLNPAAYNDQGGGQGARGGWQWRAERQQGAGSTVDDQLKHMGDELHNNPKYQGVIPLLKAAKTREDKYDVILTKYEGLPRGGPDYMTDMEALIGADAARAYVVSHGGQVHERRARSGDVWADDDDSGPATRRGTANDRFFGGSIAPDSETGYSRLVMPQ